MELELIIDLLFIFFVNFSLGYLFVYYLAELISSK
jgi:hypothetical protein